MNYQLLAKTKLGYFFLFHVSTVRHTHLQSEYCRLVVEWLFEHYLIPILVIPNHIQWLHRMIRHRFQLANNLLKVITFIIICCQTYLNDSMITHLKLVAHFRLGLVNATSVHQHQYLMGKVLMEASNRFDLLFWITLYPRWDVFAAAYLCCLDYLTVHECGPIFHLLCLT